MQKLLDKRYIKLYNTHVTKVTPCGPLAQLAEHLTFNQGVPRSSRGWITIFLPIFWKVINTDVMRVCVIRKWFRMAIFILSDYCETRICAD